MDRHPLGGTGAMFDGSSRSEAVAGVGKQPGLRMLVNVGYGSSETSEALSLRNRTKVHPSFICWKLRIVL